MPALSPVLRVRLAFAVMFGASACAFGGQPARAAELTPHRLTFAGVPPVGVGAGLEVDGGPLRLRMDGTWLKAIGGWAVGLEAPLVRVQAHSVGPLLTAYQTYMPPTCPAMPGIACPATAPSESGLAFGFVARWRSGPWWIQVSPAIDVKPQPPLLPILGSGLPPIPQPPRVLWHQGLLAGPPMLEIGYRVTPRLDFALRSSLAPLAVAWRF